MAIEIPKYLCDRKFKFVLLKPKNKIPFENEWQKNGYEFDDPKLLNHIKNGGNYGVIGGYGNLRMWDIDDQELAKEMLEKTNTFAVKTGSQGVHLYFLCDYDTNHVLIEGKGEYRANNYQCVGASCIHPNGNEYKVIKDQPIATITKAKLMSLIGKFLRGKETSSESVVGKDSSRSAFEYRRIIALLRKGQTEDNVYNEMNKYSKWANSSQQYKDATYQKAYVFVEEEKEKKVWGVKPEQIEVPESEKVRPTKEIWEKTRKTFKRYLDSSELNYNLLTTWTLGTAFHSQFETYPLILFLARKQSGKTRTLKLISALAKGGDGSVSTSVTETMLFRRRKPLFLDEMESLGTKDRMALRETLNASYKKGNKIIRYVEKKIDGVKEYVEDAHEPFYPTGLANIKGFGDVLEDRSLQIILQRSARKQTKLIEDFSTNKEILELKETIKKLDTKVPENIFSEWNSYIEKKKVNKDLVGLFDKISGTEITGRPLEIFFPLFLIAERFGVLDIVIEDSKKYLEQIEGDFMDNVDDLLQTYMESNYQGGYVPLSGILQSFRNSLDQAEDFVNAKWLGRALKRLGLVDKKRLVQGKTQIMMVKPVEFVEYVEQIKTYNGRGNSTSNKNEGQPSNNNSTNTTNTTISTNTTNSTFLKDKTYEELCRIASTPSQPSPPSFTSEPSPPIKTNNRRDIPPFLKKVAKEEKEAKWVLGVSNRITPEENKIMEDFSE